MPFDYRTQKQRQRAEADWLAEQRHPKRLRGNPDEGQTDTEDDPMDAGQGTSVPAQAPTTLARAATTQKNGRTDGSETSVDPIAEVKLRPFHDTQDTILVYYNSGRDNAITSANSSAGVWSFGVRLNSICSTQISFNCFFF